MKPFRFSALGFCLGEAPFAVLFRLGAPRIDDRDIEVPEMPHIPRRERCALSERNTGNHRIPGLTQSASAATSGH
jgi:hypothetical protein